MCTHVDEQDRADIFPDFICPDCTIICPGCDREAGVDDDFGRDEDCDHCFIDGAPETQEEVTAYYNTDCWCEERPVRDCPVHAPCFCGSPKCEACAP